MRIATWNVNSIGARLPRLLDWLEQRQPDAVALQETKCADAGFPFADLEALGYEAMHVGDGRWNGVAVLSRIGLEPVSRGLPGHPEPRLATARCGDLSVTSVYVPNGRALDDPMYAYKLDWLETLRRTLDPLDPSDPSVIMGDFNVAPTDADVWDPAVFAGSTHVTPAERAAVQGLIDWGLTDVRARPGKGDHPFTYWDYRAGMFHKDEGMRIDLVLASAGVTVGDAYVDREARKGKLPSDHAPVIVEIEVGELRPVSEREILTWDVFGTGIRELAAMVVDSGFEPDIVLGIARGGLIPAGAIAYAIDCKNLFTINVEFYTGVNERLDVPIMLPPVLDAGDLDSAKVLIVDDVADTGRTLELVHDFCAGHVAEARTAVIYAKPHSVITCDYAWRQTERWINFPWSSEPPLQRRTGIEDA